MKHLDESKRSRWRLALLVGLAVVFLPTLTSAADDGDQRVAERADAHYAEGDYRRAFKGYLRLAKKGDPFSQYRASYMYLMGEGVRRDYPEAFAWAVLAAESEDSQLEAYLGEVKALVPPEAHEDAQQQAEHHLRE